VARKDRDCSKRMAVWCLLAMALLAVFLFSGYVLYQSPAKGPPLEKQVGTPAQSNR
jgi:hypothetical protein